MDYRGRRTNSLPLTYCYLPVIHARNIIMMAQNSPARPKAKHYRLVAVRDDDDTPFDNSEQPSPPLPTSQQQPQQQLSSPYPQQQQHIMLPPQQQLQPQQQMMMPDLTANMNMTSLQDQVNMFHQQMAQGFPQPMMPFPNMSMMGSPSNLIGAPNNMAPLGMPGMGNIGPLPVMKQDASGRRQMELQLDMTGFRPEDVLINTDGNMLDIYAKSSSVDGNRGAMQREFRRQFTMPETINAENLRCVFSPDGVLTIEGNPSPKPAIKSPKKRKRVTFALTNDP